MYTAKFVVGEMQGNRGFQVRQLLAEGICESRKTTHRHAHREVLPLHKRRADVVGIGRAQTNLGYNLRDSWWGVPRIGAVVLPKVPKQFDKLREINIQPKAFLDRFLIEGKAIGRKLHAACE